MTDEEFKRYDLIVEYVNRAKLSLASGDALAAQKMLKEAQGLVFKALGAIEEPQA